MENPTLFIVATPIGNLDDITIRAQKVLTTVPVIAAEDTRRARQLLNHIGIDKKELISYYDQVEQKRAPQLIRRLIDEGLDMALVSDAGTPCISDPGYRLVAEAHKQGINVVPIPGASALTSLVSASGLPSDRVLFIGFLPTKDSALRDEIESWSAHRSSVVFYESPRRFKKVASIIAQVYPQARLTVGRELTKMYEEIRLQTIQETILWVDHHESLKGELAVMVTGFEESKSLESGPTDELRDRIKQEMSNGKRFKDLLKEFKDCGLLRQELYQLLIEIREEIREEP